MMSNRPALPHCLLAGLLCAASGSVVQAEMYKWVDEKGKTHYSNTPPAGAKAPARVDVVTERVTVYTPDAGLTRALQQPAAGRSGVQAEDRRARREAVLSDEARKDAREIEDAARREQQARREAERSTIIGSPVYVPYPVYLPPARRARNPAAPPYDPEKFYGADQSSRIGVNNAPPAGISSTPKAGVSTAPPAGRPVHSADGYRR